VRSHTTPINRSTLILVHGQAGAVDNFVELLCRSTAAAVLFDYKNLIMAPQRSRCDHQWKFRDFGVVKPNRILAERAHEPAVRVAIIRGHARRQWLRPPFGNCQPYNLRRRDRLKLQRRLAVADKLDINRG